MVVVSDLHLRHRPPACRRGEPDWYEAQARKLRAIRNIIYNINSPGGPLPEVVYPGDVFDRWDAPAELISFALRNMTPGFAVPGQHDLPQHRYSDRHRSAYGTLVAAGLLHDLPPGEAVETPHFSLVGCPYGIAPQPAPGDCAADPALVIHGMVHTPQTDYTGCSAEDSAGRWAERISRLGYRLAMFGDNHKGFVHEGRGVKILNPGAVQRTRTDQEGYRTCIGLVHSDGAVGRIELMDPDEVFDPRVPDEIELSRSVIGFAGVVGRLAELVDAPEDFISEVEREIARSNAVPRVKEILLAAMEEARNAR